MRIDLTLLATALAVRTVLVAGPPASEPRFEVDILPLLEKNCLKCHSSDSRQGGLSLQSLEGVLEGGE